MPVRTPATTVAAARTASCAERAPSCRGASLATASDRVRRETAARSGPVPPPRLPRRSAARSGPSRARAAGRRCASDDCRLERAIEPLLIDAARPQRITCGRASLPAVPHAGASRGEPRRRAPGRIARSVSISAKPRERRDAMPALSRPGASGPELASIPTSARNACAGMEPARKSCRGLGVDPEPVVDLHSLHARSTVRGDRIPPRGRSRGGRGCRAEPARRGRVRPALGRRRRRLTRRHVRAARRSRAKRALNSAGERVNVRCLGALGHAASRRGELR